MSPERARELAFQAAGAAMSVAMKDHPNYVMPTERVTTVVEAVLADFLPKPTPRSCTCSPGVTSMECPWHGA